MLMVIFYLSLALFVYRDELKMARTEAAAADGGGVATNVVEVVRFVCLHCEGEWRAADLNELWEGEIEN